MNDRTVVLLGAGASAASQFSLPTMTTFFRSDDLSGRQRLAQFLARLYPKRGFGEYNLEEVLAFLDLSRARGRSWGFAQLADQHDAETLYAECIQLVRERLEIPTASPCAIHRQLFEKLARDDTVLTLNYDLIADISLQGLSVVEPPDDLDRPTRLRSLLANLVPFGGAVPPSLSPGEWQGGTYLKLHGSLNWVTCQNPDCHNANFIFTDDAKRGDPGMAGAPCRYCGNTLAGVIVPPVATKRLSDRGRLALLWRLALDQLLGADRITIIGTSLAPSDFELRWLIREAIYLHPRIPMRIDLVDTSAAARDRVKALIPEFDGVFGEYDGLADFAERFPLEA